MVKRKSEYFGHFARIDIYIHIHTCSLHKEWMKSYSSESHFRSFRLLFASLKTLSSRRKHSHKVRRCCFHSTPFPSALDSRPRASFLVKESARSKQPRVLLRLNLVSVPSTTPRGTRRRFILSRTKMAREARSTLYMRRKREEEEFYSWCFCFR